MHRSGAIGAFGWRCTEVWRLDALQCSLRNGWCRRRCLPMCACRDGRCNGADGFLHSVVDGACIVVENASEFLTVFGLCGSEVAG